MTPTVVTRLGSAGAIRLVQHERGLMCHAVLMTKPARRCGRAARLDYSYQEHTAPLCAPHSRMLERAIEGSRTLDYAISMLIRWSEVT